MGFISFIIVLSILIFIHELGHFLIARYFGVKVEVFSIGFGKKIYNKFAFGTNWSISLIPLGGYVKMKGQDDTNPTLEDNSKDSYNTKTPFQRILILFAGPLANFILAFFLYFIIGLIGNKALAPQIGQVIANSPASNYGLQIDDTILKINNHLIKTWSDISQNIKNSQTNILNIIIKRDNKLHNIIIKPKLSDSKNIFNENIKRKMIGIAPVPKIIEVKYSLFQSIDFAFDKTYQASKLIFLGLKKMLQGIIPSSEVGGVIMIGQIISDASSSGIVALLGIMALISVNLGVLNLLPIPALDGGHIIFNLFELITRKKPNKQVLLILTIAGWMILLSLMGLGVYNDINRIIQG